MIIFGQHNVTNATPCLKMQLVIKMMSRIIEELIWNVYWQNSPLFIDCMSQFSKDKGQPGQMGAEVVPAITGWGIFGARP